MLLHQKIQFNQDLQESRDNFDLDLKTNSDKEQILVVDDTTENLKLIANFLRESGYDVRAAKNGRFALKFLEKFSPDLILLDVQLPEMDGFEICRRLKAGGKTQDIPVIFMTAFDDSSNPNYKVRGLALGAVDYISKPIQLDEVLARIKTHLRLRFLTRQLQSQNQLLAQEISVRQQQEKEISFLLTTTQAVAEADDFNTAIASILRSCCEFISWDFAEAWVPNVDGTYLEYFPYQCVGNCCQNSPAKDSNLDLFQCQSSSFTLASGIDLPGRIWQSKQPEWIEDVALASDTFVHQQLAAAAGLKAGFGVPILVNDQVLAVLVFYKKSVIPTRPQLMKLLNAVAAQVASIIKRKQVKEQLRASEERWQLALLANNDGIYDWNLKTGKSFISKRWKEIIGYLDHEIVISLKEWKSRIHGDDFERVLSATQDYMERKIPKYEIEYRLRCKDDSYKWVATRGQVLFDEDGKPLRIVGSLRDISDAVAAATQRKQAEVALQKSLEREREKAAALKRTLSNLKRTQTQLIQSEKMSSLGRMVAGIAHEINNPVSFIQGNLNPANGYFQDISQLLKIYQQTYPNPTPEIQQFIEEIEIDFLLKDWPKLIDSMTLGTERIKQIILSLRNFSRLGESQLKSVDIHLGIDSTLLLWQNRLRAEGNRPEIKVIKNYSTLPKIKCYASQLNQVFMNLLDNAIDALSNQPEPKLITINTSIITKNSPVIVLKIADNGVGMSEEVRQKMFDPFFTTKPVGKGTGLGLAISHQIIVEQHYGQISCVSTPGKGTELIVEIPVSWQL
jgi:two-component system NtrC family sensor kinase